MSKNAKSNRTTRTHKKKAEFLSALSERGFVRPACQIAGIGRSTVYDWRVADDDFATAWDDAIEAYVDALEAECDRRAVKGVTKPVGFHKGEHMGTFTTEYSDTLLMFRLKALRPEKYRERVDAKISGDVIVHRKIYSEPGV